jgi:hypothetical protein
VGNLNFNWGLASPMAGVLDDGFATFPPQILKAMSHDFDPLFML